MFQSNPRESKARRGPADSLEQEEAQMSDSGSVKLWTASRRRVLKTGGALGATVAMPYFFSRRASAQAKKLSFWQFYSPGGTVATQGKWFEDMIKSWNDQNETQIELNYIPVNDYVNGSKLQTAFASGEGPDIFIISPGDFLRYANG